MDKPKISAIIPAWNEGKRIKRVLDVLVNYKNFDEIIVVDDGSTDKTKEVLERYKGKVKLVKHKINKGKADAVLTGVQVLTGIEKTKGEIIVLFDADLTGLTLGNIDSLVNPLLGKTFDMVILDREGDRISPIGWTNLPRLFGGERSFWKENFIKSEIEKGSNYLIEAILNKYHIDNNLKVKTVYCPKLMVPYQFEKHGLLKGLIRYAKMFWRIYKYLGFFGLYKMAKYVEEEK